MSIDRAQLEIPRIGIEQERQIQYAVMGRLGVLHYLQDVSAELLRTGGYKKIEIAAMQLQSLSNLIDQPR